MGTKKRVMITIDREPYERIQEKARKANFPKNWFSVEIEKLVLGLDEILEEVIRMKADQQKLTDKEQRRAMLRVAEKTFGIKLKDLE